MKVFPMALLYLITVSLGLAAEPAKEVPPYFPILKDDTKGIGTSDSSSAWYSNFLQVMGEPALYPARKGATSYRLLILPTWGNPVAVRATLSDGLFTLTSCRLSGQGGYEPGKIAEQKKVTLGKEDSTHLANQLEELKLFDKPTNDGVLGLDGSRWLFESAVDGKYHLLNLWTIDYDAKKRGLKPLVKLCQLLIEKSQLSEGPRNKGREMLQDD